MELRIIFKMFMNILLALSIGLSFLHPTHGDKENFEETKKISLNPKLVWQSSTLLSKTADKAVNSFCTTKDLMSSTDMEHNPIWEADLENIYFVKNIVVRTRMWNYATPKAKTRFQNVYAFAWIHKTGQFDYMHFSKSCAHFQGPQNYAHEKVDFPCNKKGRYIGIVLKQSMTFLEMCRVTIYGALAIGFEISLNPKLAWMSSTYDKSTADKAVSSLCSREKSVYWASATKFEKYPGWAIELEYIYFVRVIVVRTRMSSGHTRFQNAYAFAWRNKTALDDNLDFEKNCAFFPGPPNYEYENVIFHCNAAGKYVGIVLKQDYQLLEICQVQIYGELPSGYWSEWFSWSNCSHTCSGKQIRRRECNKPQKIYRNCEGNETDGRPCGLKDCPSHVLKQKSNAKTVIASVHVGAVVVVGILVKYCLL